MIHHIQGNLLTSDCDVIAHQSNCRMGFGSGIAGQIRREFPAAYDAFIRDVRAPEKKLGTFSHAFQALPNSKGKDIYNLYGQLNYGPKGPLYTDYAALERAVCAMLFTLVAVTRLQPDRRYKIGMPWKIGCDLAGGDWHNIVYPMLIQRFNEFEMDLWLHEYNPKEKK